MLPKYEIRREEVTIKRNNYELNFPEHLHSYIEIVYVFNGVQHLKIEDTEYEITKGNAAVIFPETVHSFFGRNDIPTETLILICEPKIYGNLFPDLSNLKPENPFLKKELINEELEFAFRSIKPYTGIDIEFSWSCVILSYILNILKLKAKDSVPVEDMTKKIVKYLEENFTEPITRASLAKTFNVSECYISRIFNQKIRINLRNYLGMLRAEYAANMIRTTNETFTVISRISGFDSLRTFNRMFKAAYGTTPQEYRNNINKLVKE